MEFNMQIASDLEAAQIKRFNESDEKYNFLKDKTEALIYDMISRHYAIAESIVANRFN